MALEGDVITKHSSTLHTTFILSQLRAGTWSRAWPAASESQREERDGKSHQKWEGLGTTLRSLNCAPVPKVGCAGSQTKDCGICEASQAS